MKTKFKLATGPLSYLKEVTIDLELKGKHFDSLLLADQGNYERAVLSVMTDLMDEDPFQLTMQELYHLFLLVKVTSLGHKLTLNVRCTHLLADPVGGSQRVCGALNKLDYSLVDSDIVYAPENYKIPEIEFVSGGVSKLYEIRPPTMTQELDLLAYYQERGISKESLTEDKLLTLEYAKHRILLHLRNKETGDRFFDRQQREMAMKDISDNSLLFMKTAGNMMEEVNSFGVSNKRMSLTCKECGGKISFRLPLSAGLSL